MARSNAFYDSRAMWIDEPKKPARGRRRLLEGIPEEIPIGCNLGRRISGV